MSDPVRVMWQDNDNPYFLGRNGEGQSHGVEVTNYDNGFRLVHIEPITSKGKVAWCVVTVPLDKVDDLIAALKHARGVQIGDKVMTLKPIKGMFRTAGGHPTCIIPEGTVGEVVERDDEGQFVFDCTVAYGASPGQAVRSFVSPNEVQRV